MVIVVLLLNEHAGPVNNRPLLVPRPAELEMCCSGVFVLFYCDGLFASCASREFDQAATTSGAALA